MYIRYEKEPCYFHTETVVVVVVVIVVVVVVIYCSNTLVAT